MRNTPARRKILAVITNSDHILSYPEIKALIGEICSRVTIYRVLERLEQEGAIYKVAGVDGTFRFGSQSPKDNRNSYIHFSCNACRSVTKLNEDSVTINGPLMHQIHFSYLSITGLCPECRESQKI
ncbi:Fur family ferric uptake transcriptional regulator [Algoriphagus sp. 4150]|uniref:Fur family transcriptional regulator n=1 Tax=Algoriphagus sp. 4150 TaxID=2817756 RepID=UPI0028555104|nr:transcriptional repressor [Algoriphagus sp. 4150]MDR7131238.1 Fur family ferric uptake transcriptional regulator [Algoriphagus sp. 4150]